jgi:Flp pilus assembly protein TadD
MLFSWLNAREAANVGVSLADDFVLQRETAASGAHQRENGAGVRAAQLQRLLQRVDSDARPLQLGMFKRAKLANSFKWRLLEKGVEAPLVDELTHALLLRLSSSEASQPSPPPAAAVAKRRAAGNLQALRAQADDCLTRGANAEAVDCYQELLRLDPGNAIVANNLGVALCRTGQLKEAEAQFRRAIGVRANHADAHCNLGNLLRTTGRLKEAEQPLRRALKLKPTHLDAQVGLGTTLFMLGRVTESRELLEKALKLAPRHTGALLALGEVLTREGRFADGETLFKRAIEVDPKASGAWAGLAQLRRMTPADGDWLKSAEGIAAGKLEPLVESNLRYAIGKYYDDTGDYARAFRSVQRANELHRSVAEPYDKEARTRFVDDVLRVYTREWLSVTHEGASDSFLPVFVVGMPRSGTSLIEQIIASHPAASGAGELEFWPLAVRRHEAVLRKAPPEESLSRKLAHGYLMTLAAHAGPTTRHVVDKSALNLDNLGVIHTVFPKARVIHLQRDPIDTCLSCYFQELPAALNFTMDLADLAHYYREHHRLVAHWRASLPAATLLDVPYEGVIADQVAWTRRILEFLGLEWDERCLNFHETERPVLTASHWQVRQKLYESSVGRWRNYKKFIRPLLELQGLT